MSKGKLYLIPTPICDQALISETLRSLLNMLVQEKYKILVEDHKIARRKWLLWGLPRDCIENFLILNEHSSADDQEDYEEFLNSGFNIILMSDGGFPAFCDPGAALVKYCHRHKIPIEVPLADNSLIAAMAMYGVGNKPFSFWGFPPQKSEVRKDFYTRLNTSKELIAFMDAPYRLTKITEELSTHCSEKKIFIAYNITQAESGYWQGRGKALLSAKLPKKAEFVFIVGNSYDRD